MNLAHFHLDLGFVSTAELYLTDDEAMHIDYWAEGGKIVVSAGGMWGGTRPLTYPEWTLHEDDISEATAELLDQLEK